MKEEKVAVYAPNMTHRQAPVPPPRANESVMGIARREDLRPQSFQAPEKTKVAVLLVSGKETLA